jgi:hypothetical protein
MAKKKIFTGERRTFLFDDAGSLRDQLEQTILSEMEKKQYPFKVNLEKIKTGGTLFGTKEECIVVSVDKDWQIVISNTTVGTYLYVVLYVAIKPKFILLAIINLFVQLFKRILGAKYDIFKQQKRDAAFATATEISKIAFNKLGLKQSKTGYISYTTFQLEEKETDN